MLDGVEIPSVTKIIAPLYDFSGISAERLEYASQRGIAVHKATELYDTGDLDEAALDPVIVPYLDAWKKFKAENNVTITDFETKLYNQTHKYAGTFDRVVIMNDERWVIDIKATAALSPAVGVQLAGYAGLTTVKRRGAVQLLPSGQYKLQEYSSKTDWPTFISLLTIFNWRKNNAK